MLKKVKSILKKINGAESSQLDLAYDAATELGLFDLTWYEEHYGKFTNAKEAFSDYLAKSHFANVNPSENFDTESYLKRNLDIYHSGESPLLHYIHHGRKEGRQSSPVHLRWHPENTLVAENLEGWNSQKIAICLHVFYPDFVEKFERCLAAFPCQVDVFVAVKDGSVKTLAEERFAKIATVGKLKVVVAPNRGRNFGPILVEFRKDLLDYDLMCHVHSKKSLYSGREQTQWFDYLNQYLFKDLHTVSCLLRLFHQKPELGMYYPTSFWMMPSWVNHWTCNRPFAQGFINDWGIDATPNFLNYPVGGMFWARPRAIQQLLENDYCYEDFPEEPLANDGSWLHALERALGLLVEKNQYQQFFYDPPSAKFTLDKSYIFKNYQKRPKQLLAELRNFDVVSFDIFDTVLRREFTEPDYAKYRLGKVLAEQGIVASPHVFLTLRNSSEYEVRQINEFKGDVSIEQVYDLIGHKLDCDAEQALGFMHLEFEYDLEQISAKDEMVNLIYQLHNLDREIWFVTDTYYTQEQIEALLRFIGISIPYRLFVSSQLQLRKDSGTMWAYIKSELDSKKLSHIHVGDNVRADAQICGDHGLANMHILHPTDKWQAAGFQYGLAQATEFDEDNILKWGKLTSNFGRYPFLGE